MVYCTKLLVRWVMCRLSIKLTEIVLSSYRDGCWANNWIIIRIHLFITKNLGIASDWEWCGLMTWDPPPPHTHFSSQIPIKAEFLWILNWTLTPAYLCRLWSLPHNPPPPPPPANVPLSPFFFGNLKIKI